MDTSIRYVLLGCGWLLHHNWVEVSLRIFSLLSSYNLIDWHWYQSIWISLITASSLTTLGDFYLWASLRNWLSTLLPHWTTSICHLLHWSCTFWSLVYIVGHIFLHGRASIMGWWYYLHVWFDFQYGLRLIYLNDDILYQAYLIGPSSLANITWLTSMCMSWQYLRLLLSCKWPRWLQAVPFSTQLVTWASFGQFCII